jgi:hypothetical protein
MRKFEDLEAEMRREAKGKCLKAIEEAKNNPQIIQEKLKEIEQKKIAAEAKKEAVAKSKLLLKLCKLVSLVIKSLQLRKSKFLKRRKPL